MREILRTNDLVLISLVEALLGGADVPYFLADAHVSAMEGGIGAFPRRLLVPEDDERQARRILKDAGLGAELTPERGHAV
ncbi:hypothetical protein GCM10007036_09870 [Alsobacter metallidurans]|uniref:DUF2007 domain-containing protein n=1 Tax=Alsobacter metallidurans TaxID=340221 RepID=A0A917I5E3_9HYPH|nr:DUF2007 domain-containing protein [Alsobacter metallidurans]GGH12216.1 hypothetical protein GCM10007036_09870 [Alsobacter metallidurans]